MALTHQGQQVWCPYGHGGLKWVAENSTWVCSPCGKVYARESLLSAPPPKRYPPSRSQPLSEYKAAPYRTPSDNEAMNELNRREQERKRELQQRDKPVDKWEPFKEPGMYRIDVGQLDQLMKMLKPRLPAGQQTEFEAWGGPLNGSKFPKPQVLPWVLEWPREGEYRLETLDLVDSTLYLVYYGPEDV